MEKLYKKLEDYSQKDYYPFHMPGHKRNLCSVDGSFPFERDITEIDGFDNLHHATGILREAQEAAARLYGSKECFYSVNGSTAALLAAISATVKRGGRLLVARNCHKAVYHGMYLREIDPVYIYPHIQYEWGINGGITPSRVERSLEENGDVQGILITSPTYDGVVSDVQAIAEIAHRYGIPLIVDEAHGAHFQFSDYFPVSAGELGADLVIQSLHKTLPSMTQTALLHRYSDRVDSELLKRFMGIYQSSSPSYILMASMDACMDRMAREGASMFDTFTQRLERTRIQLMGCHKIRLASEEMVGTAGIYDYDRSKLIFSTRNTTMNGQQLHTILREKYHLEMEMESEDYILAMATVADTEEGLLRLEEAIREIDREEEKKQTENISREFFRENSPCIIMKQMMKISDALEAPVKRGALEESVGKTSAEFVYLYPPGIPILVPGEQITGHFVRNVRRYMEQGLELQGLSDYTGKTICTVT